MRCALLLAAGCLIGLCQPGLAGADVVKLSKPGGTWTAFLNDTAACNHYWSNAPENFVNYHVPDKNRTLARSNGYFGCLARLGYRADPGGYFAGKYLRFGDTSVLVPSWGDQASADGTIGRYHLRR